MEDEVDAAPALFGDSRAAFIGGGDDVVAAVIGERTGLDDAVDQALDRRFCVWRVRSAGSPHAYAHDEDAWCWDLDLLLTSEDQSAVA